VGHAIASAVLVLGTAAIIQDDTPPAECPAAASIGAKETRGDCVGPGADSGRKSPAARIAPEAPKPSSVELEKKRAVPARSAGPRATSDGKECPGSLKTPRPRTWRAPAPTPNEIDRLFQRANQQILRQDHRAAVEELEGAFALSPDRPTRAKIHHSLGITFARLGDLKRAAQHYRAYLECDPDGPRRFVGCNP
jgi:tetratricopeptide (TPR) repeat protein